MARVINLSNKNLRIKRTPLVPQVITEVDGSASELRKHLFVKAGWVEVMGSAPKVSESKTQKSEDTTETSED